MNMLIRIVLASALLPTEPAFAQSSAQSSAKAPRAVAKEFSGYFSKFRAAVKKNDSAAVAGLSRLPFMADPEIGTPAQFKARVYTDSFDRKSRTCLQTSKPVYERDGAGNHTYSVICGETIFTFTRTDAGFQFTDIGMND